MDRQLKIQSLAVDVDFDFKSTNFLDGIGSNLVKAITASTNVTLFEAEKEFSMEVAQLWFQETLIYAFCVVGIYLCTIFGGSYFMKKREKYELRELLVIWNFGLAIFSIMGAIRVIPELVDVLFNRQNGFYHSVCLTGYFENKVMGYWNWLFVLSKWVELGDTLFIVLRKQPLLFLHWYHHVTVLLFTWYTGGDASAPSRWYSCLNFFVHSLMYTYYGLKALKFRIPKPVALTITSLQLFQMVVGVSVIWASLMYKQGGLPCEISYSHISAGLGIYVSYWLLFARFLYRTYFSKAKSVQATMLPKDLKQR